MLITAADEAITIPVIAKAWAAVLAPSCWADSHLFEEESSKPSSQTKHSSESFDSHVNQLADDHGDTVRKTGFWLGDELPVSKVSIEKVKLRLDVTGGVLRINLFILKVNGNPVWKRTSIKRTKLIYQSSSWINSSWEVNRNFIFSILN